MNEYRNVYVVRADLARKIVLDTASLCDPGCKRGGAGGASQDDSHSEGGEVHRAEFCSVCVVEAGLRHSKLGKSSGHLYIAKSKISKPG